MPELPEVETVCRTLRRSICGLSIHDVTILWPNTIDPLPADVFRDRIIGERIESVGRRAKLIVFRLESSTILSVHLRMTGLLHHERASSACSSENQSHLRAAFQLNDGSRMAFYDARKFGRIRLYTSKDWRAASESFGPEPLDSSFTADKFHDMLRSRSRQLKPLLLDQRFIAGIGNIYADEALFRARLHPQKLSSTVSRRKSGNLHAALVEILTTAVENQGTTIRDYRPSRGATGQNQTMLRVYGAPDGAPCPRCGALLKKSQVGQRTTTYCPRCQRLR